MVSNLTSWSLVQAPSYSAADAPPPALLQMVRPTQPLTAAAPIAGASSTASSTSSRAELLVGVELVGTATLPVSTRLTLQFPTLAPNGSITGWAPANASALWLEPATLSWLAGEQGSVKSVKLRWAAQGLTALQEALRVGALSSGGSGSSSGNQTLLRVQLAAASSGATLAEARRSTELQLDTAGAPLFAFLPNQAAYQPAVDATGSDTGSSSGVASIPVRLLAGRVSEPTTLRYTLRLLASQTAQQQGGQQLQFLPRKALSGFLRFEPQAAAAGASSKQRQEQQEVEQELLIQLPLAWGRIPPGAEYRLGEC